MENFEFVMPDGRKVSSTIEAAKAYARLGMGSLVRDVDKKAIDMGWNLNPIPPEKYDAAFNNPAAPADMGLLCGAISGIACLDIDTAEGFTYLFPDGVLPDTLIEMRETPDGGKRYHMFFKYSPELAKVKKPKKGIELLSDDAVGGPAEKVTLSPRVTGEKRNYNFIKVGEGEYIKEMPEGLRQKINEIRVEHLTEYQKGLSEANPKVVIGKIPACIQSYLDNGAPEGERNLCSHKAAVFLANLRAYRKITKETMMDMLLAANMKCAKPRSDKEVLLEAEYAIKRNMKPYNCRKLLEEPLFARACDPNCPVREKYEKATGATTAEEEKKSKGQQAAEAFADTVERVTMYPMKISDSQVKVDVEFKPGTEGIGHSVMLSLTSHEYASALKMEHKYIASFGNSLDPLVVKKWKNVINLIKEQGKVAIDNGELGTFEKKLVWKLFHLANEPDRTTASFYTWIFSGIDRKVLDIGDGIIYMKEDDAISHIMGYSVKTRPEKIRELLRKHKLLDGSVQVFDSHVMVAAGRIRADELNGVPPLEYVMPVWAFIKGSQLLPSYGDGPREEPSQPSCSTEGQTITDSVDLQDIPKKEEIQQEIPKKEAAPQDIPKPKDPQDIDAIMAAEERFNDELNDAI